MAFYRLSLQFQVTDSGRSSGDTNNRATRAARLAMDRLANARNVAEVLTAKLENGTVHADGSGRRWDAPPPLHSIGSALELVALPDTDEEATDGAT